MRSDRVTIISLGRRLEKDQAPERIRANDVSVKSTLHVFAALSALFQYSTTLKMPLNQTDHRFLSRTEDDVNLLLTEYYSFVF